MQLTSIKRMTILLMTTIFLLTSATLVLAVSGTWYSNGYTMYGNHNHVAWINPLDRKVSGSSSTPSPQPIDSIYVDVRLEDRCKNSDGTWQSWHQYGFKNKYASSTFTTGTIYAQGTYQNCIYGHEYRNKSLHSYNDASPYLNQSHWLQSS